MRKVAAALTLILLLLALVVVMAKISGLAEALTIIGGSVMITAVVVWAISELSA